MLDNADREWREKIKSEINELNKKGLTLSNNDIVDRLSKVLENANKLLLEFVECVIGKDRALILQSEMQELDKIAGMQSVVADKEQCLLQKNEQLEQARKNVNTLTSKMK
jgi:hypothetical protein